MTEFVILAQAGGGSGAPNGQSMFFMPVMIFLIFGFMIFSQFRNQRKKDRERKEMLSAIKSGDRVLFSGGIIGTISSVKDKTYVLRIGDNTKIEVLRGAVTSVIKSEDLPADAGSI